MKIILQYIAITAIITIGFIAVLLQGVTAHKQGLSFLITWEWWLLLPFTWIILIPSINYWKNKFKTK